MFSWVSLFRRPQCYHVCYHAYGLDTHRQPLYWVLGKFLLIGNRKDQQSA
jgi:hypothetical protein